MCLGQVKETGVSRTLDVQLRGVTWQHRRAIDPVVNTLGLFASCRPGITVDWSSRPLHGFEFAPIEDLARDFDLIVFDHPFVGDVAASGCLLPLDDLVAPADRNSFVGPSLETYVCGGRLWAIPIDAACQVAVSRPDLMARLGASVPADWSAAMALGRSAALANMRLAMALRGVHALMTFFTLCANLGKPCGTDPGQGFADQDAARMALSMLRELVSLCADECLDCNSIEVHERMAARDDLVFCPAVYCYATYAETGRGRPLRFHRLPGPRGSSGSTIGGAGLGISALCKNPDAARAYARFAASAEGQFAFARHHGQPALTAVWEDEAVNAQFGDCYRAMRDTMERCWTRPRYHGYLAFQAAAGELIERHLRGAATEGAVLDELEHRHACATAV